MIGSGGHVTRCCLTPVVDRQEKPTSRSSSWSQTNLQRHIAQSPHYQGAITPNQGLVIHPLPQIIHTQLSRIINQRIPKDAQRLTTTDEEKSRGLHIYDHRLLLV